jgi:hypothetical protein
MQLSNRGIALATAALQVAAVNRAARAGTQLAPRSTTPRLGRRRAGEALRRTVSAAKG